MEAQAEGIRTMNLIASILWLMLVTVFCVVAMLISLAMLYVMVKGTWIVAHAVWVHSWP